MIGDKDSFLSFAAPSSEDIVRWDALPEKEKLLIAEAELAKGMAGTTHPLTPELKYRIFGSALTKAQEAHEQN